jgi:hypothetical protein
MDRNRYMMPEDLKGGELRLRIKNIVREIIDERPRLVIYFDDFEKGLILTRQCAEDISQAIGRNRVVDEFFASPEGAEH